MKSNPIRHIALTVAAASALLSTSQNARAQESHKTKSGIIVTDWTFNPDAWDHGMTVHRFDLENTKPSRQTVRISIPGERYAGMEGIRDMTAHVTMEGGSKAAVIMPQPPMRLAGGTYFTVQPIGGGSENFSLQANDLPYNYNVDPAPKLLASRTLSAEALDAALNPLIERVTGGTSHGSAAKAASVRLMRAPQAWPGSWVDYSSFDGCFVGGEDYMAMPAEVRSALRDYVSAGGVLMLVGMSEVPPEFPVGATVDSTRSFKAANVGFGKVVSVPESDISSWSETEKWFLVNTCYQASRWIKRSRATAKSSWRSYTSVSYQIEECMSAIPLGMSFGVPVNFTILLLVLFAVIAGPVAVIVAARRNRRIALLWAVPAFSLVFSAIIFVAMLFSEGITPTQRRQAITLLDQDARHASTLGAVGVYSPTALSGGISFEYGTEINPLVYTDVNDASILFGQRQQYTGGWTPPRMAAFFSLRRSERRAERLVVEKGEGGKMSVVNALGAPIELLRLYDADGALHEASDIPAGARMDLKRVDDAGANKRLTNTEWVKDLLSTSTDVGWSYNTVAKETVNGKFRPDPLTYVAKLEACPFIENPLEGRRAKGTSEAIVIGKFSISTGDAK